MSVPPWHWNLNHDTGWLSCKMKEFLFISLFRSREQKLTDWSSDSVPSSPLPLKKPKQKRRKFKCEFFTLFWFCPTSQSASQSYHPFIYPNQPTSHSFPSSSSVVEFWIDVWRWNNRNPKIIKYKFGNSEALDYGAICFWSNQRVSESPRSSLFFLCVLSCVELCCTSIFNPIQTYVKYKTRETTDLGLRNLFSFRSLSLLRPFFI